MPKLVMLAALTVAWGLAGASTASAQAPAFEKKNHTYSIASRADRLVVHFLGAGNFELARLFGEQTGDEIDKFSRCAWTPTADGLPVLHGTLGWVACRVLDRFDAGDHVGHLVEPIYGETTAEKGQLGFQAVASLQPGHAA